MALSAYTLPHITHCQRPFSSLTALARGRETLSGTREANRGSSISFDVVGDGAHATGARLNTESTACSNCGRKAKSVHNQKEVNMERKVCVCVCVGTPRLSSSPVRAPESGVLPGHRALAHQHSPSPESYGLDLRVLLLGAPRARQKFFCPRTEAKSKNQIYSSFIIKPPVDQNRTTVIFFGF